MDTAAPQTAAWINFLGWLETNKHRLVRLAIGIGVVAALLMIWFWYRGYREVTASQALSSVRQPYGAEQPQPGISEQLMAIADKYAGTQAGSRALLSAGRTLFLEGKYAQSQAAMERFLKEYPNSTWFPQARFSAAAAVDAQGKAAEAITLYTGYISSMPNDPFTDEARWNLGRLYENTGKFGDALDQYQKLSAVTPGSPSGFRGLAGLARERTFQLYQQHPELRPVPTNQPPRATITTPSPTVIPGAVVPGASTPTAPAPGVQPGTTPAPTPTPAPAAPTAKPATTPAPAATPPAANPPAPVKK